MLNNYDELLIIYNITMGALKDFIKKTNKRPNEKIWNQYAIQNNYLSSESIGYISGTGFNKLCRELIKKVNKEKNMKQTVSRQKILNKCTKNNCKYTHKSSKQNKQL